MIMITFTSVTAFGALETRVVVVDLIVYGPLSRARRVLRSVVARATLAHVRAQIKAFSLDIYTLEEKNRKLVSLCFA